MAKGNYYFDKRNYKVYTSEEIPTLSRDVQDNLTMAAESEIVFDSFGKPMILNSMIEDIKQRLDTEKIIEMVNKHSEEAKAKQIELAKIEQEQQKKAEYAERLERMKEESLAKRRERIIEVYEVFEKVGRGLKRAAIIVAAVAAIYGTITFSRASRNVNESHGARIVDSSGTIVFTEGTPEWSEYHDEFWNLVADDFGLNNGFSKGGH